MNPRRCMSNPKLKRRYFRGSNEHFDGGWSQESKTLQCTTDVRFGSLATEPIQRQRRSMSAMHPIATNFCGAAK